MARGEESSREARKPEEGDVDPSPPFADEPDEEVESASASEAGEESASDVGFFLALAGRYPLLSAERERELARTIWAARRRIANALALARKSKGGAPIEVPRASWPERPISPTARRRLIAAEEYAERLLRLFGPEPAEGAYASDGFDRSLAVPPALAPPPRRGRRSRGAVAPLLTRRQFEAIEPVLREELERIRAAREELVESNLRLVVWVAKGYRGRGLDLVDLIQEGNLGLLRAIDRYDPAWGTRFATFATHWIRQGIRRALAEKARTIRIPVNRLGEVKQAAEAQSRLAARLGRDPTAEELAEEMQVDPDKLAELLPALGPVESIEAPIAATELRPLDFIPDTASPSPFDRVMEKEAAATVERLLAEMPERDRRILAMRYGIGYPEESTLEEIGRSLGLSRERIRQLEKQALRELAARLEGKPIARRRRRRRTKGAEAPGR